METLNIILILVTILLSVTGSITGLIIASDHIRSTESSWLQTTKGLFGLVAGLITGLLWPVSIPALTLYGGHRFYIEYSQLLRHKKTDDGMV